MKTTFPKRLKALRESMGLTQQDFADMVGITRPTIGLYETASRLPDIEMLHRICNATGCQPDYLLGYSPNMHREHSEEGYITGLSDKALEKLWDLKSRSSVTDAMICHKDFDRLVGLLRTANALYQEGQTVMAAHVVQFSYLAYMRIANDVSAEKLFFEGLVETAGAGYIHNGLLEAMDILERDMTTPTAGDLTRKGKMPTK